jgi:hypothetical protein
MEFMKDFFIGQKLFFADLLAPLNFILLAFAYIFGVGLSFFFLKKGNYIKNKNSFWVVSELTKKEPVSHLKQF